MKEIRFFVFGNTMTRYKKAILTNGHVGRTLLRLTLPMVFGLLGMFAFNLIDVFFVGKLGTSELAALSFTFPVVMCLASLALGIGFGAAAVISRAIGEGNHHRVQRLTTDSLFLAVGLVGFLAITGLLTMRPVFTALGAKDHILPLIEQYMSVWYSGIAMMVVPMVGNNAIRALGDTKTPSMIMLFAVALNAILDPLLIFGIGPFPHMGIKGAAVATVLSRGVTLCVAVWVLGFREKMLSFKNVKIQQLIASWRTILYLGLPTAGTRMVIPLALAIITRLVASYGPAAVAGFGIATRIEAFAMTVIFAMATSLGPFVGQNFGAENSSRIKEGVRFGNKFSILWGLFIFAVLFAFAQPIARAFNKDPEVVSTVVLFLRIVPLGYAMQGALIISAATLVVLHKPFASAGLIILEMFVLCVPLAFLGSSLAGVAGIFWAFTAAYIVSGLIGERVLTREVSK